MDRNRFDALTRVIAARGTRRGVLSVLVSVPIAFRSRAISAESDKGKGKGHDKDKGNGHGGKGQGHENDDICAALACEKLKVPEGEPAEFCCKGGYCSCGGTCCPENDCFQTGPTDEPARVFCCTGPKLVICENTTPVECCEGSCDACGAPGPNGIAGSYRRP